MNFSQFKEKFEKVQVNELAHNVSQSPKVSVFVQTYQHVKHIKKCLDSILSQETNFEFEILLGDDVSTDGTREICIEYAEKYPEKIRLFLHHRENNIKIDGFPTGRFNFLYNFYVSNGEFITICEGDDYWTDHLKLQKQVDFLNKNKDYLMISGGFISKHLKSGNETRYILNVTDAQNNSDEGFDIDLEIFYKYWAVKTLTLMVRKDSIDIDVFFKYYYASDIHLNYHLLKKGKGYYMKQIFGVYNITGYGVATSKSKEEVLIKKLATYNELYKSNKEERLRIICFYSAYNLLRNRIKNKDLKFSNRLKYTLDLLSITRKLKELKYIVFILPLFSLLKKEKD